MLKHGDPISDVASSGDRPVDVGGLGPIATIASFTGLSQLWVSLSWTGSSSAAKQFIDKYNIKK
jgi:hypothetical protein